MRVKVSEDGTLIIGEVFSGAYLETSEGNRVGFCMRDDTVEINILPKAGGSQWIRIDMQDLCTYPLGRRRYDGEPLTGCDPTEQNTDGE